MLGSCRLDNAWLEGTCPGVCPLVNAALSDNGIEEAGDRLLPDPRAALGL